MRIMSSLALRHLRKNKKQSFSVFLAVVLSVSMLVAVSTFFFSIYGSMSKFARENDLMETMTTTLSSMATIGVLLGVVITGAAIVVITNAFSIQAAERTKQFGVLKSVGATELQIKQTITAESNWLSLISIPVGIVGGHLLCYGAILAMKGVMQGDDMEYAMHFNPIAILIAVMLSYATVRTASSLITRRVSKLSAIEAIRLSDDAVKISGSKLKSSRIFGRIFGFEGTLASKQLKRNRRKFRVTVFSLVTSIVMFLAAYSFGDTLISNAIGAYADTGANVVVNADVKSADLVKLYGYAEMLRSTGVKSMGTVYHYHYVPDDTSKWIKINALDDADYAEYCQKAGVKLGTNVMMPFDKALPFEVKLDGAEAFTVTETSAYTTPYLKSLTMTSHPTVVVPIGVLEKLGVPITANYYIVTDNATDYVAKVKAKSADFGLLGVDVHNTEEYTRELQRMYAMLMAFVYCFIGMLALIGATSVLATINSNINLRRAEFATLQAVGMSTKKLNKMLNLESLLYGVRSLVIGIPIGLLLSYGMFKLALAENFRLTTEAAAKIAYSVPGWGIVGCVLGVFVINFVSMYFATSRLRRGNIAETMRELT